MRNLPERFARVSFYVLGLHPHTKLLTPVWLAFLLLIALGINGSNTPVLGAYWNRRPNDSFVFGRLKNYTNRTHHFESPSLDNLLLTEGRGIRSDDFLIRFPLALSQISHNPRFPVVNTNYWTGRNMLVLPAWDAPVWHISAIARPASWGYFLLGAQRGVSWECWFQIFACFTVLYLLLDVMLRDKRLAGFGSFWFCESAGVVAWGYWPTYVTFFIGLAALSAYYLLKSDKPRVQMGCGVLLGLSASGFSMVLYPPWQIPLGYLFLVILIGLVTRDKLYLRARRITKWRIIAVLIAIAIAGTIVLAYLISAWDALKVIQGTIYPGHREDAGGGLRLWQLFAGAYNIQTSYTGFDKFIGDTRVPINESEASSFYLLFPALLAPLALSRKWRRAFGGLWWLLSGYLIFMIGFTKFGLPHLVTRLTLFDRAIEPRVVTVIGLASIFLCMRCVKCAIELKDQITGLQARAIVFLSAAVVAGVFGISGILLAANDGKAPTAPVIVLTSLLGGLAAYFMVRGESTSFIALVGIAVLAIASVFNPLSSNLNYIYKSELAQQIQRLDDLPENRANRPLWVCYGNGLGAYGGVLVSILGGRAISGIQWPPPLDFWHAIDPARKYESFYNNWAHIHLNYTESDSVTFSSVHALVVDVSIKPDHPVLKSMGAKYILAMDDAENQIDANKFPLVYKSVSGYFSIYRIP